MDSNGCLDVFDRGFSLARPHIFYASPSGLSVAFVNLKPLVPGHVLVVPSRVVPRMAELSKEDGARAKPLSCKSMQI